MYYVIGAIWVLTATLWVVSARARFLIGDKPLGRAAVGIAVVSGAVAVLSFAVAMGVFG